MNITIKVGGKDFKIYSVIYGDYLINFSFLSKVRDSSKRVKFTTFLKPNIILNYSRISIKLYK